MVRECKRRFLEKNKNKDKTLTKKLTIDEIIINIIEPGGTINDFIKVMFPTFLDDVDETDEECKVNIVEKCYQEEKRTEK